MSDKPGGSGRTGRSNSISPLTLPEAHRQYLSEGRTGASLPPDQWKSVLAQAGFSDTAITEADVLLNAIGFGNSDATQSEVMEHIQRKTETGRVLLANAQLEEVAYHAFRTGQEKRGRDKVEEIRSDMERWERRGWNGMDGDYDAAVAKRRIEVAELHVKDRTYLYRRGRHGRVIEGWTPDPEGTGQYRNPNLRRTYEELHAEGYRVLSGLVHRSGEPDEEEITLARIAKPKRKKS